MSTKNGILRYEPSYTETYYEDAITAIDDLLNKTVLGPQDSKHYEKELSSELTEYNHYRHYIETLTAEMQESISALFTLYNDYVIFPDEFDYVENEADYFSWIRNCATDDQIIEYYEEYAEHVETLSSHHQKLTKLVKEYLDIYFDLISKRASFIKDVA